MSTINKERNHSRRTLQTILATAIACAVIGQPLAAPGTLSQSPLFLSTSVQSNIFFVVDDSGSMFWEDLLNQGTQAPGNAILSERTIYNPPSGYGGWWDRTLRRLSCVGYNSMAYDPSVVYTPWQGLDRNNNAYGPYNLTTARRNPYEPSTELSLSGQSLSNHYYWVWNDMDGDGAYDGPGSADSGAAANATTDECGDVGSLAGGVRVGTLSAAEQTNYANWYSYYRKREYVAKRALSQLITESTSRMGLSTLWNNNNVRTPIKDVDNITTPINATANTDKNALLRNLFRVQSNNGTPLRRALQNAGIYYESGQAGWGSGWSSPILPESEGGDCQQNFTVVMSDGFWNNDTNAEIVANNADGDNNTTWDGGSYADAFSDTLADVAMYYYERDLKPALDNNVRRNDVDQNDAQHMVTFTVAFGVDGTLTANPTSTTAPFAWPQAVADTATAVDDMRHAAWNGRGKFLNAGNPTDLIRKLNEALANISDREGSAAAVAFNSTSLQSDTLIFQALFDPVGWKGNIKAIPLSEDGEVGANASWSASGGSGSNTDTKGLDERNYLLREIYTYNGTAGVEFDWANLTTAQKNDLKTNPSGTLASDAAGKARLGFIKGDRSCEEASTVTCDYDSGAYTAKAFRDRTSILGDIVHSSPLFVGAPNTPYPDNIESVPYSNFVNSSAQNRRKAVYVGSNDGMLHAFDADNDGQELFAYIPSMLYSTAPDTGLHYLTDPTYIHRYYVDLSATAADVYLGGWKTLLVGGLRGGGKGVFALDITDPASFDAGDILWEFTNPDLGYSFSDIRIGKLNNGKWAAIFGNGYNNDPAGDGRAKLFIVYLDGSNLSTPMVISTGAGSMSNSDCGDMASDCNGLSSPALADLNGDGTIDRVYAGDLHGNLWAFNISSSNTVNWDLAYAGTPLARACTSATCTTGNRQPITSRPSLARHKTQRGVSTGPNLMVFFGTGQYMSASDNDNSQQQTFYGIWDSGSGGITRSDLQAQILSTDTSNGQTVRTLSDNTVNYPTQKGWYINLPTTKERVVTNSTAIGDLVFFSTMIPSSNQCGYGGSGWLMLATQLNGGAPTFGAVDVNGDGVIDAADLSALGDYVVGIQSDGIPTESRFISDKRVTTDSSGAIQVESVEAFEQSMPARTSWSPIEY